MSAEPAIPVIDEHRDGPAECWCCGSLNQGDRMVQLGIHPEVVLCIPCAHFVHQRAWEIEDDGKRGPASFARDQLRSLRAEVVRRRWHHNRLIGGGLRWLGRYLP
jgi:hypothetical protein